MIHTCSSPLTEKASQWSVLSVTIVHAGFLLFIFLLYPKKKKRKLTSKNSVPQKKKKKDMEKEEEERWGMLCVHRVPIPSASLRMECQKKKETKLD